MPQLAGKPLFQSMGTYKIIGENIRELRREIPVTQIELARSIGISHDTLSNIELGKCRTEFLLLKEIAAIFETTADVLTEEKSYRQLCDRDSLFEELRQKYGKNSSRRDSLAFANMVI